MGGWLNVATALCVVAVAVNAGMAVQQQRGSHQVRSRLLVSEAAEGAFGRSGALRQNLTRLWGYRRRRHIAAALPAGLEAISRSLRSGASLPGALTEAAGAAPPALGRELDHIAHELTLGRSPHLSFAAFERRQPLADVRLATAALGLAMETGGARSRALDGLAQSIRDRQALRVEVSALASQARMSAVVMAILPLGFLGVTAATDEAVAELLTTTRLGALCLVGGIGLDVLGLAWMQVMVRRA